MANQYLNSGFFVNQGMLEALSTLQAKIGDRVEIYDKTYGRQEAIYLYGVASLAANDLVAFNPLTGATTRTLAATAGHVAVSLMANTDPAKGSWFITRGTVQVNCAGTVVAGALVYSTATAGQVDDTVAAGSEVYGAFFAESRTGAGLAAVALDGAYLL